MGVVGQGRRENRGEGICHVLSTKSHMGQSYNKMCTLSHSCPTVLLSKGHFHQAVSFSFFRNFTFAYMRGAYLQICLVLKCVCNLEINACWASTDMQRATKHLSLLMLTLPADTKHSYSLCLLFQLPYCKQGSFPRSA